MYIIAEIGLSHDGSLGNAIQLGRECLRRGANAVKLQDHTGQWVDEDAQHPPWFLGDRDLESRAEYLERTRWDSRQWEYLYANLSPVIVSLFDESTVEFHAEHAAAFKVASGQVTNLPMLRALRDTERRVFISTGLAAPGEWERAAGALDNLAVPLMCVTEYPAHAEDYDLSRRHCWGMAEVGHWGVSDHTMGHGLACTAAGLGARYVEKHVCFSRYQYGSDSHGLTLEELNPFCRAVCEAEWARIRPERTGPDKDVRKEFMWHE